MSNPKMFGLALSVALSVVLAMTALTPALLRNPN